MGWEPLVRRSRSITCSTGHRRELLPVCINEGVAVMVWGPLRGGWLSGKYRRGMDAPPDDSRLKAAEEKGWSERWSNYNNERTWGILDVLFHVADEVGKTPAQVAFRWLLQRPGVTAPIVGALDAAT
jgi:aryl-alcohol dehydrogenase-like predicted oxidoreductase